MSASAPIVSVVTANYNGAAYLAAAVRSVLDQSLAELELIIVDDRSSDDSLAVIEHAAAGDPRVRVLEQTRNGGPAAARNRALDVARGRWIAVFDSDDLMAPNRLEALVARGEADSAHIVADDLLVFSEQEGAPARPYIGEGDVAAPRWITTEEYIAASLLYARRPSLGYLKPLFRADVLRGSRYREDLRIGEDYDLVARLLLKGCAMRYDPRALYRYRKHAGSISHALRREHIERMLAADESLAEVLASQPASVQRAQRERTRSLRRGLVYDRIIAQLKGRAVLAAAAESVRHPDVWPLLGMPIEARLKRLSARFKARAAPAHDAALA